jgi:hypothetical protein
VVGETLAGPDRHDARVHEPDAPAAEQADRCVAAGFVPIITPSFAGRGGWGDDSFEVAGRVTPCDETLALPNVVYRGGIDSTSLSGRSAARPCFRTVSASSATRQMECVSGPRANVRVARHTGVWS